MYTYTCTGVQGLSHISCTCTFLYFALLYTVYIHIHELHVDLIVCTQSICSIVISTHMCSVKLADQLFKMLFNYPTTRQGNISEMATKIIAAFKAQVSSFDWLDSQTKELCLAKVSSLHICI